MMPIDQSTAPSAGADQPESGRISQRPDYIAAQLQGTTLPSLAIKLSTTYSFAVRTKKAESVAVYSPSDLIRQSYIAPSLISWDDNPIPVSLAKGGKVKLDLAPGVTIVMGKSGAGKTALTLGRIIEHNENALYVRYGEPVDSFFMRYAPRVGPGPATPNENGVELALTEPWLASRIASVLAGASPLMNVLIVDSLRHLVFGSGGNTGKGGVNMTLFSDLSFLDVVAAARGIALVVIINPMTDDKAAYDLLLEVASGSVAGVLDVASPTEIRTTSRYSSRRWSNISLPSLAKLVIPAGNQSMTNFATPVPDLSSLTR